MKCPTDGSPKYVDNTGDLGDMFESTINLHGSLVTSPLAITAMIDIAICWQSLDIAVRILDVLIF